MDDDFFSILTAIRFGRDIYDNIRKQLQFFLTFKASPVCVRVLAAVDYKGKLIIHDIEHGTENFAFGNALLQIAVLLVLMYKKRDIFGTVYDLIILGARAAGELSGRLSPLSNESLVNHIVAIIVNDVLDAVTVATAALAKDVIISVVNLIASNLGLVIVVNVLHGRHRFVVDVLDVDGSFANDGWGTVKASARDINIFGCAIWAANNEDILFKEIVKIVIS